MTETKYLPLLIPCSGDEGEGTMLGKPVRTIPYRALDLFLSNGRAFEEKYGALDPKKAARLRNFLKFTDAVRISSRSRLAVSAKLYLFESEVANATRDPSAYLQNRLNPIASKAAPVLWQERKSQELSAGIFCKDISIATAVLTLFRIASAQAGETGECVVCKKLFVRERGYRRRTCSDRCRMSLSRENRRISEAR